MNNKKLVTFLIIGLVVLIAGGLLVLSSDKKEEPAPVKQAPIEEQISTIKPEDIGLVLTASSDNRKVILEVKNTQGLAGVDYELSYTSKGDIPRGVLGHIDIKQEGKAVKQEITLGTCSDVCHYDQDVSGIKLIVKVTKLDNKVYSIEKSLEL